MPFIPALGRQRQADLCEFRLVYRMNSGTGSIASVKLCLEKQTNKQKKFHDEPGGSVAYLRGRGRCISEFEASLVHRNKSSTAGATQKTYLKITNKRTKTVQPNGCIAV